MKKLLMLFLVLAFTGTGPARADAAAPYVEGQQYHRLAMPQPVDTGNKIEVREIFWYGCPHCYRLQPFIDKWLANGIPADATFVLMPGILRQSWADHARIFYAFKAMGMVNQLHEAFFNALHRDNKKFPNLESIAAFVAEHGGNANDFVNAYNSFAVDADVRRASELSRAYGVTGVPSIIVDGKYRTSVSDTGSEEELFKVINFLVKKSANERRISQ